MGLDDLVSERKKESVSTEVGDIKPSFPVEEIEMRREWWQNMALHNPSMLAWRVSGMRMEQIKLFIHLLDKGIQDDIRGVKVTQTQKENMETYREELVEEYLDRL